MRDFLIATAHLDPVAIVKTGSYLGIAIVIFMESGIFLGLFFPGDSLLFIAGLLSATGFLEIKLLILIVVGAAILGDTAGYWFGKRVGVTFFTREDSYLFKKKYVVIAQKFFLDYGGRAIILARFVPMVRTITPILAGIGSMKYTRFISYNAFGGIVWGAGMTSLGYLLGSTIPNSEQYVLPLSLGIIGISFLPILIKLIRERRAI